jgi:hypothetical protein
MNVEELAPIAAELNRESDDLNTTITAINKQLAALNVGVPVWFSYFEVEDPSLSEEEEDRRRPDYYLGFAKCGDYPNEVWQLAYREWVVDQDETYFRVKPLLTCTRNMRVECLEVVDQIVKALSVKAAAMLKTIRSAKSLVK